jgi:hypothetical protein
MEEKKMKVRLPSFAYAENLKVPEEPKVDPIPDDIPLTQVVEQVIRGRLKLSPSQMRLLIAWMPHFAPRLAAVSVGYHDGTAFADRLDRAIEASDRAKLIEAHVTRNE